MKKIVMIICCMLALVLGNMTSALAASYSISASTSSVAPGGTFTVSVGGDVIGRFNITVSNGSANKSSVWVEDNRQSITITAGSSGNVVVTATPVTGLSDTNGDPVSISSRSTSVAIKSANSGSSNKSQPSREPQEDPRSKNNNLKSLSISQGALNPKFSASQTEYSVSLSADVTEMTVDAKADDSKAKVSGTGKQSLKAGKNDIKIVCTSEYGTKKEYIIHATVDEKPLVYLDYNDAKLGVVRNYDGIQVPDGFKETTIKVQDHETKVWVNADMKKTIIYLMDADNQKNFYLYNDGKVESVFKPITISGMKLYMIDIDEKTQKREGMTYTEIEVDKQKIMGWTFQDKSFENYMLIYVMDTTGEMKYYQYEKTTNTLQPYSHAAPITDEAYQKSIQKERNQKMIFMGLSIALAIVIIGGVIYYFKKIRKV